MGHVLQAGQGQIPSRQAQINAGIPREVSSETINKVCASGIRAAGMLDAAIRAGDIEVGVAGGMESMSNAPYLLKGARFGYRMGDGEAIDAMINDGLRNPFTGKAMALEASEVALELEMTRPDMDRWALRSHELAIRRHRRGPAAGRDRPGDGQRPQGRDDRRGRRGAEAGQHPRGARQATAAVSGERDTHGRQLSWSQRRRRRHGAGERRVGPAERQDAVGEDRRAGPDRRRVSLPRPDARQGVAGGTRADRAERRRRSTSGRSTRRSRRSR